MRIGVIGTGSIASAVVRALAPEGHEITVSERGRAYSAALAAEFANVTVAANAQVVEAADLILIGLLPEHAEAALGTLTFREGQQVISLMADVPLDQVATLVAPASVKTVMLPYPSLPAGGTPIMVLGETALVETLLGARNTVFALRDRAELGAYLAAQAVLSPATQLVAEAANWLAPHLQDPARGEAFLRMLVSSSLAAGPGAELLASLNTEGGYNQGLRQHMERAGMVTALHEGLDALTR
ncbi:coenzyme F420-dependent NADP oxidoreductase-like protein [Rhodobacter aestuarii]|uniref:Pyrroline-5-carboxylate reductase n=1 Tax=Rhodobacter aestuarii TaxID=453582 RepID=A0A1N7P2F6_9RHOB|nr:NAD(P)-binding domain-containing protein [Rhodobacter aestuarii]PTV97536.1 coenzyme F420-dependent NADP oxidoreductase-like protein [Rhodobacter aestuarii]SIT04835.1 pyrroline-5-carboxylate reductase [Rhodobacter aestuarii]